MFITVNILLYINKITNLFNLNNFNSKVHIENNNFQIVFYQSINTINEFILNFSK